MHKKTVSSASPESESNISTGLSKASNQPQKQGEPERSTSPKSTEKMSKRFSMAMEPFLNKISLGNSSAQGRSSPSRVPSNPPVSCGTSPNTKTNEIFQRKTSSDNIFFKQKEKMSQSLGNNSNSNINPQTKRLSYLGNENSPLIAKNERKKSSTNLLNTLLGVKEESKKEEKILPTTNDTSQNESKTSTVIINSEELVPSPSATNNEVTLTKEEIKPSISKSEDSLKEEIKSLKMETFVQPEKLSPSIPSNDNVEVQPSLNSNKEEKDKIETLNSKVENAALSSSNSSIVKIETESIISSSHSGDLPESMNILDKSSSSCESLPTIEELSKSLPTKNTESNPVVNSPPTYISHIRRDTIDDIDPTTLDLSSEPSFNEDSSSPNSQPARMKRAFYRYSVKVEKQIQQALNEMLSKEQQQTVQVKNKKI